jgi:hypothetical protein
MRLKHLLVTLTACGALSLLALVPAAQAANGVDYDVSGSYLSAPAGEGTFAYSYDGTASCATNCTGAPTGGTFTLGLSGAALAPPNPCISRRVSGTLTVTWSDATTTTAILEGRNRDRKGFSLSGTVTGGTSPFFFPPDPIKGFVSLPPNPCVAGSFTGSLTFYPGPI